MKIIPHAKLQPEKMAVIIIYSISKWKVFALFFTVFFGKHTLFKEVQLIEATDIKLHAEELI